MTITTTGTSTAAEVLAELQTISGEMESLRRQRVADEAAGKDPFATYCAAMSDLYRRQREAWRDFGLDALADEADPHVLRMLITVAWAPAMDNARSSQRQYAEWAAAEHDGSAAAAV